MSIGSHWPFEQGGRFLPEHTIAASIPDRLLHHAIIVVTDGESYRMKDAQHRKDRREHQYGVGTFTWALGGISTWPLTYGSGSHAVVSTSRRVDESVETGVFVSFAPRCDGLSGHAESFGDVADR